MRHARLPHLHLLLGAALLFASAAGAGGSSRAGHERGVDRTHPTEAPHRGAQGRSRDTDAPLAAETLTAKTLTAETLAAPWDEGVARHWIDDADDAFGEVLPGRPARLDGALRLRVVSRGPWTLRLVSDSAAPAPRRPTRSWRIESMTQSKNRETVTRFGKIALICCAMALFCAGHAAAQATS